MTTRRHEIQNERLCRGFTLIEMIVVLVIVLVLAGLILPGASSMWNERKIADTETLVQGMLQTARSRATRPGGSESGLFFYLDENNTQRIVSIEKDATQSGKVAWDDVFRITGQRQYKLPKPMRVVPRYIVDQGLTDGLIFDDAEIVNEEFATLAPNVNNSQRHRNYFTMVYTSDGRLVVRRDVLLQDLDADPPGSSRRGQGDITGLPVPEPEPPTVKSYYTQDDNIKTTELDPDTQAPALLSSMIFDPSGGADGAAINFPSVDGVLAYDNDAFNELETALQKRTYLLENARPFYVNRYTGGIIRGPIGEN